MPQFLFVVAMPTPGLSSEDPNAASRWFDFAKSAKSIALPKGAMKLPCENVWLFPVETSEPQLRALANTADEHQLSHSTFLVSGKSFRVPAITCHNFAPALPVGRHSPLRDHQLPVSVLLLHAHFNLLRLTRRSTRTPLRYAG